MTTMRDLAGFASAHLAAVGVCAAAALAAAFMLWRAAWRAAAAIRTALAGRQAEDVLTVAAAAVATAVAMNGMWRFFGTVLHFSGAERVSMFAFLEIAVVTSAFRARRNVREFGSAGVEGIAVWAFSALSAVFSALDARSAAEAAFRLAPPLVAAWLWERGLSLERYRARGRLVHWRLTAERVLVWLGLAEPSARAVSDVDAHRRIARVARAAKKLRELRAAGAASWRHRRARRQLDKAMQAAVEHADLACDPARQDQMRDQIGALTAAESLASLDVAAPWDRREAEAAEIARVRAEAAALADEAAQMAEARIQVAAGESARVREWAAKAAGEARARVHAAEQSLAAERARAEAAERALRAVGAERTRTDSRTEQGRTGSADREVIVAELTDQIRDAIESGERWQPDYPALMARTGFRRSWCEKAVRDARTAAAFPGARTDAGETGGARTESPAGQLARADGGEKPGRTGGAAAEHGHTDDRMALAGANGHVT